MLLRRAIEDRYLETVASRRVTVVTGPRQAGKTTLVASQLQGGTMLSLDEPDILEAALADPKGFIASGPRPFVIDEVQRAGEPLVRAIKAVVDRDPTPGQFVLTGSSNFLTVPTISESLAGRAGFIDVWPFTQGELTGHRDQFIDIVLNDPNALPQWQPANSAPRAEVINRLCLGGYPEAQRLTERQRAGWFHDYVQTTVQRDIAELSNIRKASEIGQLLRLLAARTGTELVMQSVITDAPLERQAVYDYRAWLETIHLVAIVPAWSRNLTNRVKRRPKLFLTDPGLAAWLLGKTPAALAYPADPATGQLVETFVYSEIRRQLTWADAQVELFHWQDRNGGEVDLVLETGDGRVIALEIKASQTPRAEWFRWLGKMRDAVGPRFIAGISLYTGDRVLSFGDRLLAVPIQALWQL